MSELSETFKRAILTFTHADGFVVSLYKGAYVLAEDISDRITDERKFHQLPADKQIEVENEIGAAVAFFNKMLPALFIMQMSFLEDWLLEICQVVAGQENISHDFEESGRFMIREAKSFFEQKLLIHFPDPWPVWEKLMEFHRLREYAVNHTGLEMGPAELTDTFLVEVDRTIVSFLEQLKTYLPNSAE
jgi:hypothetical protein